MRSGLRIANELLGDRRRAALVLAPVSGLLTAVTIVFLVLFVG